MLNYEVDPALLSCCVPQGTSLDSFQGKTYVSLVGFRFCRTKLIGHFPIPFHTNFDEVNLRFYVRRKENGEERRGVVFIAEVVPKRAIATTARVLYGENYVCLPISTGLKAMDRRQAWSINGEWAANGARFRLEPRGFRNRRWKEVWSNSSPNTTGGIRGNEAAGQWSIGSSMFRGRCGLLPEPGLKATGVLCTGKSS